MFGKNGRRSMSPVGAALLLLIFVFAMPTAPAAEEKRYKLAVMEIEDRSGKFSKEVLGNATEYLRSKMVSSNKYVVISKDRQQKEMIKGEKKESHKECYDQSCRIQLGQALSADTVLAGSITKFGGTFTLTVEIIDLAKEATIQGAEAEFENMEKGLKTAIEEIAEQLITGRKRSSAPQAAASAPVPAAPVRAAAPATDLESRYDQARDLERTDKGRAIEMYEDIMDTAEKGSKYHLRAEKRIAELKGGAKPVAAASTPATPASTRYTIQGGKAIDPKTGLVWQRDNASNLSFEAAESYCRSLNLDGEMGWVLPTIDELRTLMSGCPNSAPGGSCKVTSSCRSSGCADDPVCSCGPQGGPGEKGFYWEPGVWRYTGSSFGTFWSSTSRNDAMRRAWAIHFYSAYIFNKNTGDLAGVRCVKRGAKKN